MKLIESHTIGEPTRIIISGGPDLGTGPLSERARLFREQHDRIRRAICLEPRGHDAVVGGLLCEPHEPGCDFGIIFFNNATTLGMCIHGTIGLMVTLAHLGRVRPGDKCRIDTPVGVVDASLHIDGKVSVTNVPCYRLKAGVTVELPGWGKIRGDVAWGGNWFFLIDGQGPEISENNIPALCDFSSKVCEALKQAGVTGDDGSEVDHVELFAKPATPTHSDSRNFVLCSGGAYDRSPCGTGFSAKLACLAADDKLAPGAVWRQASILDQVFEGTYEILKDGKILPHITGQAWVNGETNLIFHADDPFQFGLQGL
jgi:4-hydroxyproline epimerase